MTTRQLTLWSCEPGIGRRTLAAALVESWMNRGESVVCITVDPSETKTSSAPDEWVPRFKHLPPDMLRNFLVRDEDGFATIQMSAWPTSIQTLKDMLALLRRSFQWTLIISPTGYSEFDLAALDASDALLWLAKPGRASRTSYDEGIRRLAGLHFSNAFSHLIVTQNTGAQDALALATLPKDTPPWLRVRQAVRQLIQTLDSRVDLFKPIDSVAHPQAAQQFVDDLKDRVQPQLLKALEDAPRGLQAESMVSEAVVAQQTLEACLADEERLPASREARHEIYTRVLDDVLGLGPLEPLLKDPTITEIMVNGANTIYVERKGKLQPTTAHFSSTAQLRTVIDRIVAPLGRRVDESMPICDARLMDGSRVNIVLSPLALNGATVTIRKFSTRALGFEELIAGNSMSAHMAEFLIACIRLRQNVIISGGTGSGKTTLLNALSSAIPDDERIVTIEDAAELKLQKPHIVRLESRPPNAEGEGAISIRRLVINALRMRPDRIVVGECRGGEALDMLQAMNTGHDGSMTTVHANTPRDALGRLETLVLMAGMDLPVRVVREQIRSAVHIIVQQARLPDGSRKMVSITELTGLEGETLVTQELFRWNQSRFEETGIQSRLAGELKSLRAAS